jgi:pentatricopeptide repeat protein
MRKQELIAAVVSALTFANALAQTTPDSVQTRLGTLNFERGYPTEETKRKVFDEIDYQRAVQAYLWAYPVVSFESIRIAGKRDLGLEEMEFGIADKLVDSRSIYLTANDTTVYAFANADLGKTGPIVVEVPPGFIVGLIDDFWQRAIVDLGMPGPDGDKGGKVLIVPPDFKGEIPKTGYHVRQATMNNYNIMVRGIAVKGDFKVAEQVVRKMRLYRLSEAANPKPTRFVTISGKTIDTLPPQGLEYWARLSAVINNNPVHERDRFFMAMLKPLGIEKGKPFNPDARQRAILEDAARIGDAMGRVMLFDGHERISGTQALPGTNWHWVVVGPSNQEAANYSQIDERLHYTYGAIYTAPGIGIRHAGAGSTYIQAFKDKDGNRLDGGKSYRPRIPADVPAAAFWSLTLYDTAIRSMIKNSSNDSARSGYDKLKANADGSIDLYFGPKAPAGVEAINWIETVSGRGFYPMVRFYGPKAGLFDAIWKLADVELMK